MLKKKEWLSYIVSYIPWTCNKNAKNAGSTRLSSRFLYTIFLKNNGDCTSPLHIVAAA